jgi:hypothetical protein
MVIGTLNAATEVTPTVTGQVPVAAAAPVGDNAGASVFHIPSLPGAGQTQEPLVTITGWLSYADPPRLSARGTPRRVLTIEGNATNVAMQNIEVSGGTAANGGGIFVDGASLALGNGALVTRNTAAQGAGIYAIAGIVDMRGGEIRANLGPGVSVWKSIFAQQGGTIRDNAGTGVQVMDSEYTLRGGSVTRNNGALGGGVYLQSSNDQVFSTFTMKGGDIPRNTLARAGGGIYVDGHGVFVLENGTITGNGSDAALGGGVAAAGARVTIKGGEISGNLGRDGGGIYLGAYTDPQQKTTHAASLAIEGGMIRANRAQRGGGVYAASGILAMSAGVINGDNAALDGGGIYVAPTAERCILTGAAVVSGNTARRGGGLFVPLGTHTGTPWFTKEPGGTVFGGAPDDLKAWADLSNKAQDGLSHAIFLAAPTDTADDIAVGTTVAKDTLFTGDE